MKKVQKLMFVVVFLVLGMYVLSSCGGNNSEEAQNEETEDNLSEEEEEDLESEDMEEEPEEDMEEELEEDVETEISDTDWDEALTEYEEFVEEYIALLKKANAGDNTALTEYPAVLQKAQDSSQKLGEVQSDLTPEQLQRFMAIQQKLAKAASEIK